MKLYLIVFEEDGSCNWFFKVAETPPENILDLIAFDYLGLDREESLDGRIGEYWINEITKEDGYNINLVKED